jgi:hypothetical protein
MTRHDSPSAGIRDIVRWWPLILLPALLAVGAAVWSMSQQAPAYTATTRLVIVPLAQWDETFLGTSLVRDSGDAKRTATTLAAVMNSRQAAATASRYLGNGWTPELVDKAIEVAVVQDTNVIEVVAESTDPARAVSVSEGFARATLDARWQTISAELDSRIAAVFGAGIAQSPQGDAATRLQTLTVIRQSGADPTLRLDSTSPAVQTAQLPFAVVVALAAAGGLFLGLLAAFGVVRLRSPQRKERHATPTPTPSQAPAYSPNGGS